MPLRYGRIVVRAEGEERVEAVVHAAVDRAWRPIAGSEERIEVDTLCVGYGFQPSVELLRLAGCAFEDDEDRGGRVVVRDAWLRTTAPGVSAAGDGTGVEGSVVAIAEGRLAALGAAVSLGALEERVAEADAAASRRALRRARRFRRALRRMHAVGPGIFELATPETTVCRCEDVARARIDEAVAGTADVSVVKGLTRAGMGGCQGRNCERQIAALIARRHDEPIAAVAGGTPRAPVRPVALGAIADATIEDLGFFGDDG